MYERFFPLAFHTLKAVTAELNWFYIVKLDGVGPVDNRLSTD